jgi:methylthioribose-1-phosphate isomerase
VTWRDGRLDLLDQRRLPADVRRVVCEDVDAVIHCIRDMVVRGAPAIGIAAAYGAVLAARQRTRRMGADWRGGFRSDLARLKLARPTAVNLAWAVERMLAGWPRPPAIRPSMRCSRKRAASTPRTSR